jgi:cytochrome d ubiquinol oxidase subunit I
MIFYDRLQFAFTITFYYIFSQLTMGLSLIIVNFKWKYLRNKIEKYNDAAKFFMKNFAVNFTIGVITGIPMEFQFGVPIGQNFPDSQEASLVKLLPWKDYFPSF